MMTDRSSSDRAQEAMRMNHDLITRRVRLQRTPSGKAVGAAVMIGIRMLERYVTAGTEYLDVEMIPQAEGILLKIRGCES